MENTASHTSSLICPFCEAPGLRDFGRNSARCGSCGGILGRDFLETLQRIVSLPDTIGHHACECGHPEMRLLPDGVYRCPACGSEVLPLSATPVTWKSPGHTDAYSHGWLDGRYGDLVPFPNNRGLARWSSANDRLDYYRGHREGRAARTSKVRLLEAS